MPMIGLRSSPPIGGRTRRKIRRYGSAASRMKPMIADVARV